MTTMTVRGDIDADGTLRLAVPMGLPAGPAEVVLVVQPVAATEAASDPPRPLGSARSGLFTRTPESDALDIDAVRKEINDAWKAKLMEGL
jgi:hypothetical protein